MRSVRQSSVEVAGRPFRTILQFGRYSEQHQGNFRPSVVRACHMGEEDL